MENVRWARDLAKELLGEALPRRWAHSQGVGGKAKSVAHIAGEDAELLISAAWLHDIGYAPTLVQTGLHALDGARYLRDVVGADNRICRLVANHSCAIIAARNRGIADELAHEFPVVDAFVLDVLTYCDMTTSPTGRSVDVEYRLAEILDRYVDGDVVNRSIKEASSHIIACVQLVAEKLSS